MNENEMVFCLRRQDLEEQANSPLIQDSSNGMALDELFPLPHFFIRRSEAEINPAYKQIIPYQLFTCGDRYFVYQRGAEVGEGRLAGRLSLGIGGHINANDATGRQLSLDDYYAALQREREEELICPGQIATSFIGWINDDSDPVGQVHLGAVHLAEVDDISSFSIRAHGEDIHTRDWWTDKEIMERRELFEKWSLLALELASKKSFLR